MLRRNMLPLTVIILIVFSVVIAPAYATKVLPAGDNFEATALSGTVALIYNNGGGPSVTCERSKFKGTIPAEGGNKRNTYDGNASAVEQGGSVVKVLTETPTFENCTATGLRQIKVVSKGTWYYDWYATRTAGAVEVYVGAVGIPTEGIVLTAIREEEKKEESCETKEAGAAQPLLGDWANGMNSTTEPSKWMPRNQLEFTSNCVLATPVVFKANYQVKDTTNTGMPVKVLF